MRIQIREIKINPGRREASPERVAELAKSIAEIGLLNPVTLDRANTLIAGLHRLEAAKLLGWDEVDYTVSSLEGLRAELAEIDENFVRTDLSAIEYGEILLRRKEIYEALHPETIPTNQGGPFRGNQHQVVSDKMTQTTKSFVEDTAEKLGVGKRTVERQIQTAKNMTPEAKAIIRDSGAKVTKKDAMKLSRLKPEQQKDAASQLAAQEIRSMAEYQPPEEPEPQEPVTEEPAVEPPPFKLSEQQFTSFRESVAALKDTEKDFSCTPDSFLAEITAFVRKFHREIEWYSTPYYEAAFPDLSSVQLDYLHQQMESICCAANHLLHQVERMKHT
ncbi:hypothetical protein AGATL06_02500 [Agathobaculum sp. TL06]